MTLTYNGTTIDSVVYNGVDLDQVIYNGVVVFEKATDIVFNVSKITSNVYKGSTTYNNCKFLGFSVIPFDNQTAEITYGGITKTVTGSTATNVYFGQYGAEADDGTADTGDITFKNVKEISAMSFNSAKATTSYVQCINSITDWGNLEVIGDRLFSKTTLTTLTIGNKVKKITKGAFIGASNLTSLTISASVEDLGYSSTIETTSYNILGVNYPFEDCTHLAITVSSSNQYFSSENGNLFNKNKTTLYFFGRNYQNSSYTIPNSVTFVQSGAFRGATVLTTINLNNTTRVNSGAFSNFTQRTRTINGINNLTQIGGSAFQGSDLSSIVLSSNLSIIGDKAFGGSPSSITFNGYKGSQTFSATLAPFRNVVPTSAGCAVTCNADIPSYFFAGTSTASALKISNLTLNNVSYVRDYAFNFVSFLATNMTIGDSALIGIGESAFRNGNVTNSSGTAATNYTMTIGPIAWVDNYALETFKTGTVRFTTEDEQPSTEDYTTIFGAISSLGPDFNIEVPDQFYDQYYYSWEDLQPYIIGY